jgi:putative transposase
MIKKRQISVTISKTKMARKSRIDASEALHHIIVRGFERRSIFVDAPDWQNFLERSGHIFKDFLK